MNRAMTRGLAAVLALAPVVVLSGCNQILPGPAKAAAPAPEPAATAQAKDPLEITPPDALRKQLQVGSPPWGSVELSYTAPGRFEADETRMARIGTSVAGRITGLFAVEGQSVHKGQLLASIYSTELSEAQFGLLRAQTQQQLTERAAARARQLVGAGVVSEAELQRREAEHHQAVTELSAWRDRLRVLGVSEETLTRLQTSRTLHSESQALATLDGAVLERRVTPGQIVQPADTLFLVADLSSLWLVADVPEQAAGTIAVGKSVEAEVPALPGTRLRGKLTFVSATVNPETRTVRVRMDVANPQRRFKPAMLANLVLKDAAETHQLVPSTAVVRENNQDHVFVTGDGRRFALRPVTLGAERGEQRILTAGLKNGEQIVLDGAFHLNNERKRASLASE